MFCHTAEASGLALKKADLGWQEDVEIGVESGVWCLANVEICVWYTKLFDTLPHVPSQTGKYTVVFQASCFGWASLREGAVGAVSLVQVQLERQKH